MELRSVVYFIREESFYVPYIHDSRSYASWYYFKYRGWRVVLSEYVKGAPRFSSAPFPWIPYQRCFNDRNEKAVGCSAGLTRVIWLYCFPITILHPSILRPRPGRSSKQFLQFSRARPWELIRKLNLFASSWSLLADLFFSPTIDQIRANCWKE